MARYRRTRRSRRPLRRSRRRPRRSFVRRRGGRRRMMSRQRPLVNAGYLMPKKLAMTTTYCESLQTAAAAATYYEYIYSGSNMYDPNITGVGHQPLLFDEMMAFYEKFYVSWSSIYVEIMPKIEQNAAPVAANAGSTGTVYLMFNTSGVNLSPLDSRYLREQPTVKWARVGTGAFGGPTANKISASAKNRSLTGQWALNNPDCSGNISGGPIINTYWHVYVESSDLIANVAFNMRVTIRYRVIYYNTGDFIAAS